ncbi:MAG: hypothetical protein A2286_11500 [Gammaproteobacteria bacterium RIFOXYA12_FULL_61_12]|nr:MAG: hypothetical protein A2514_09660 [Gammaproteobacteria bacterium RIFOXYD12_FULL_61_37]OGT94501.1 MAG: hypothetical protein A2286_11500 [Gammaproteobacteria bacterium RIFOXYA12_FULL_61_12]
MHEQTPAPLLLPTPPQGEEARVEAVFRHVEAHLGMVPDGLRLYGISPDLLDSFLSGVSYFLGHKRLSQELLTMIRYLASERVGCRFCISLNEARLAQLGVSLEAAQAARDDLDRAPISERERPLLRLALKGVTDPDAVQAADLDAARAQGWSDRDLFDVVALAANNRAFTLVLKTFKVEQQGAFA